MIVVAEAEQPFWTLQADWNKIEAQDRLSGVKQGVFAWKQEIGIEKIIELALFYREEWGGFVILLLCNRNAAVHVRV